MPKFRFGKLVRDKIVDQQLASGAQPKYRALDDASHKQELINKIIEEAKEISSVAASELASEIADLQQALDDLKEKYGLSSSDITKAQKVKNSKYGSFKKGLFIDYLEIDEKDEWVKHFRDNPERYPELD